MKISAIAVISKNRVLGKDGRLLFHVPGDLPRFQKITSGHPVIMGRRTFESKEINKRALSNRVNIVVTRDSSYRAEGVVVARSVEEAIEKAKKAEVNPPTSAQGGLWRGEGEIFIIGGGQIYKEAWQYVDKLYLTVVDVEAEGDTYFPDYSDFTKVVFREEHEEKGLRYAFLELER
ncbi:dihydrofolate reductase [Patescibacteria group bacterium]|nr:dihydrofolate reductase [Patescibacteria group bacterium]MBU4098024.1 dihydrofolate reductase [Patescibacteria group bacterium]